MAHGGEPSEVENEQNRKIPRERGKVVKRKSAPFTWEKTAKKAKSLPKRTESAQKDKVYRKKGEKIK